MNFCRQITSLLIPDWPKNRRDGETLLCMFEEALKQVEHKSANTDDHIVTSGSADVNHKSDPKRLETERANETATAVLNMEAHKILKRSVMTEDLPEHTPPKRHRAIRASSRRSITGDFYTRQDSLSVGEREKSNADCDGKIWNAQDQNVHLDSVKHGSLNSPDVNLERETDG